LQWAWRAGDALVGLQLAGTLMRYWRNRGYLVEGREWLAQMLALPQPVSGSDDYLSARLSAAQAAAWIAVDQHDFGIAEQLFGESLNIRRALGESADGVSVLVTAALEARAIGQYGHAAALFGDALAQLRTMGDQGTLSSGGFGYVLYYLAHTLREQGDFASARALYMECTEFHTNVGYRAGATQGLLGLSDLARDLGDTAEVRHYANQALTLYREFGTQWAIGFCLNNLALAAYFDGDLDEALALISESVSMFRAQKAYGSLAEVLVTLGAVLRARGDFDGAYEAFAESLRLGWGAGLRVQIAAALEGIGGVLVPRGDARMAAHCLAAAALMRQQMGTPIRPAERLVYDHALAAARAALGGEAFEAAWTEAQRLPPEQIVSIVVGE
jgi:tetratricopeptide (TPR) repeat protein